MNVVVKIVAVLSVLGAAILGIRHLNSIKE